jgi:hypothetical protein
MVFNAPFNNISVISWRSVSLVEEIGIQDEKNTNLSQVTNKLVVFSFLIGGGRGRDRVVARFTTTCAISAYHR